MTQDPKIKKKVIFTRLARTTICGAHSGTGYSRDFSSKKSNAEEKELEVEVRKEVFGLLSINEKFARSALP